MFGLRPGTQDGGVYVDVQAPELLVAGDVLRGSAGEAVAEIPGQVDLFNIGQFTFRVGA
jgi:hypothetical protein